MTSSSSSVSQQQSQQQQQQQQQLQLTIEPGAIVSPEARLSGAIFVGKGTIIQPKSIILAESGPIKIGKYNIVEEYAIIINRPLEQRGIIYKGPTRQMVIGESNLFEVGCQIMASEVGDCNTFEPKSIVGEDSKVGSGTIVSIGCQIPPGSTVQDQTAYSGPTVQEQPLPSNQRQRHLEFHNKHLLHLHKIKAAVQQQQQPPQPATPQKK